MADMTQLENQEGQGPEEQLDTKSELEPKSVVTLVYRGANPFMRTVGENLRDKGLTVTIKEISPDEWQKTEFRHSTAADYERKLSMKRELVGELNGVVITDQTLAPTVKSALVEAPIYAYAALERGRKDWSSIENIIADVTPVIEEIRQAGKIPVVQKSKLGDHFEFFTGKGNMTNFTTFIENFSDEEIEQKLGVPKQSLRGYGDFYSALLAKYFDLGNNDRVIPTENKVRIGDHHVFYVDAPWDAEIAFICPCCIGLRNTRIAGGEIDKTMDFGYRFFPLTYKADITPVIDKLMEMIEEKRAELEAQKLSAHSK